MGSPLTKVGDFLGGVTADLKGQGVSFRAERDARRESSLQSLDMSRIQAMAKDAQVVSGLLGSGKHELADKYMGNRIKSINDLDGDASDSMEFHELIRGGKFDEAKAEADAFVAGAQQAKMLNTSSVQSSQILADGTAVQVMSDGDVNVVSAEGNLLQDGAARSKAIKDARQFDIDNRREIASIDVDKAGQKKRAELSEVRNSDFITDLSTRNRRGARSQRLIGEALSLSAKAADGLSAPIMKALSKLPFFEGIDVSDEAALEGVLDKIALEQLQSFKGPTTDFEFGVTKNISGELSDRKSARNAKLRSLQRAEWFNRRELTQFNKHTKNGGSIDDFAFNFNEVVTGKSGKPLMTKQGEAITLKDIQETAVANNLSIEEVLARLDK